MSADVQDWAALLAAIERANVFDRRVALMRDSSGTCGYLFAYVGQLQPGPVRSVAASTEVAPAVHAPHGRRRRSYG